MLASMRDFSTHILTLQAGHGENAGPFFRGEDCLTLYKHLLGHISSQYETTQQEGIVLAYSVRSCIDTIEHGFLWQPKSNQSSIHNFTCTK